MPVFNGTASADRILGSDTADQINGLGGNDSLSGLSGDDVLDGGEGDDNLFGGEGNDTYIVDSRGSYFNRIGETGHGIDTVYSAGNWSLGDLFENLVLTGTGDSLGQGNGLDNIITGNSGNNALSAGNGGTDVLIGGGGNDHYYVNASTVVVEAADGGIDRVFTPYSRTLEADVEILYCGGTAATGNELDNIIYTGGVANLLDGAAGDDTLIGGAGDDTYEVDSTRDRVIELASEGNDRVRASASFTLAANVETLILTGTAAINGVGNELGNTITGNAGANVLNGGAGDDVLVGGAGNDVYDVDSAGDRVIEAAGEGYDRVRSSVSYSLAANVEELNLVGTAAINGFGNGLDNTLTGNTGANVLSGGGGADRMIGGAGDDTYDVESAGDQVIEAAGEGIDRVRSSIGYALAANIEILTLTGTAAINGVGNALDNTLVGNAGANVLNGGAGDDVLIGGAGNDVYDVDSAGDRVIEAAGEGYDRVRSAASHAIGANVEELNLVGTAAINGFGNGLDNTLTGNAGANVLSGGGGADRMIGGAGDDTYDVDSAGDRVVEAVGEGIDRVRSSIGYALGANIESLTLTGTTAIGATGNALDNSLVGNAANNVLYGFAGADLMIGGAGDDTYDVDLAGDRAVEAAGEGNDRVRASVSHQLEANIEILILTGTADIDGTGNALANTIVGNAGANVLDGGAGADALIGGAGDDTYYVESGNGVLIEEANGGFDRVFSAGGIILGANIEQLTLTGHLSGINVSGNAQDNIITGNDGVNYLSGNGGDDVLSGGGGADHLTGGAGADRFLFVSGPDGHSTISDFSSAQGDKLAFQGLLHGAFSYLGAAAFTAGGNSEARFAGGQLFVDTDGNGAVDITVTLTGITNASQIHASDFAFT